MQDANLEFYNTGLKLGRLLAFGSSLVCLFTFSTALMAIPVSGSYCPENCVTYPFAELTLRYPVDFFWMYPAMVLNIVVAFLFLMIIVCTNGARKLYAIMGGILVWASSLVLFGAYFVQVTVLPANLLLERPEALVLFSQYDEYGTFIALEDAGYLLLGLGFAFLFPAFVSGSSLEKWIAWVGGVCGALTLCALAYYSLTEGLLRGYRFEVAAISINWIGLIVLGIMFGFWFGHQQKS